MWYADEHAHNYHTVWEALLGGRTLNCSARERGANQDVVKRVRKAFQEEAVSKQSSEGGVN